VAGETVVVVEMKDILPKLLAVIETSNTALLPSSR
jgi:hypothetical protein